MDIKTSALAGSFGTPNRFNWYNSKWLREDLTEILKKYSLVFFTTERDPIKTRILQYSDHGSKWDIPYQLDLGLTLDLLDWATTFYIILLILEGTWLFFHRIVSNQWKNWDKIYESSNQK